MPEPVAEKSKQRSDRDKDKRPQGGANPMRWEWEDVNHHWTPIDPQVSVRLEEAEKARLGRVNLMAGLHGDGERSCTFLLNQRKVVLNDSGVTYLIRRRQPKITGGSPMKNPLFTPNAEDEEALRIGMRF